MNCRPAALAITAASAFAVAGLVVPQVANAAGGAHCSASASPKHPGDNSNVTIAVNSTVNGGRIRTVAHYKSTDTTRTGHANKHGNGATVYDISSATYGFKVKVSVTVTKGSKTASCSTAFTPR